MPSNSDKTHGLHLGHKQYGRPRTRRPVRRVTLELEEELLADVIELAAGASPLRVIVEAGLQMWLNEQRQSRPQSGADNTRRRRERPAYEPILQQQE
jgi:hypothetical protein